MSLVNWNKQTDRQKLIFWFMYMHVVKIIGSILEIDTPILFSLDKTLKLLLALFTWNFERSLS